MTTAPELIEKFKERTGSDIPLKELKLICSSPFEMMKRVIKEGELEEIRIQYLFVAKVSPSRVIKHLRSIYSKESNIKEEVFLKRRKMLFAHISRYPDKFNKYKKTIKEIVNGSKNRF